jgi:hypothetical protein
MSKFPSQFSRSIHVNTSSQVKVTIVESIPLVIFSLSLTQNANLPSRMSGDSSGVLSNKHEIVIFSGTAIALYGYDQGKFNFLPLTTRY